MSEIFARDELAFLIVVPILYLAVFIWQERRRRQLLDHLISRRLIDAMVIGASPSRRRWKAALRALALTALVLAAMRPQWGSRQVEVRRRGIDLVFVVDTSKSMLAQDVQPSRMEAVKQELSWFVSNALEEDRIALVAFAGTARTLCPLTLDRPAFEIFLSDLDVGIIPLGGTDLDAAIREALATFDDDQRNHKAVMIFSDGEAHAGVPEEAVERANKNGVRLYTVGVGRDEGVPIPTINEAGDEVYLRDSEGSIVTTRIEDRILKSVAQLSIDGAFVNLTLGRNNLEKIYFDNVKSIEGRELAAAKTERRIDRFIWFVGVALLLLVLDFLIAEGRQRIETKRLIA